MGTNCAPVLANLFLYYYEAEFIQMLQDTRKELSSCYELHLNIKISLLNSKSTDITYYQILADIVRHQLCYHCAILSIHCTPTVQS